jgi:hypothetical protein
MAISDIPKYTAEDAVKDAATFERPKAASSSTKKGTPGIKAGKVEKVAVDSKLIDVEVTERYPRSEQSENYRVEVLSPLTGVPLVRIAPVGWVGPVPLQVPEARLDELIELLNKVR